MLFLKGNHGTLCFGGMVTLFARRMEMIGEHTDTTVHCMKVHFRNVIKLQIQQLKMSSWVARITPVVLPSLNLTPLLHISSVRVESDSIINIIDMADVHIGNTSIEQSSLTIEDSVTSAIGMDTCVFHHSTVTFLRTKTANVTMKDCVFVNNTLLKACV